MQKRLSAVVGQIGNLQPIVNRLGGPIGNIVCQFAIILAASIAIEPNSFSMQCSHSRWHLQLNPASWENNHTAGSQVFAQQADCQSAAECAQHGWNLVG